MPQPHDPQTIRTAKEVELTGALELLLDDLPPADRVMHAAQLARTLPAEQWGGLFVAERWRKVCGVVWGQQLGGGAAMLWPPRQTTAARPETADQLVDRAVDWLRQVDVQVVQSLLPADAETDATLLQQHGFTLLPNLAYLASDAVSFPKCEPESALSFVPVAASDELRLADLVAQTYRDTLDFPELNGLRSAAEVLEEYRSAPQYDPALWFLVRHGSQEIGCLLLNDHADLNQLELVYVGLIPAARGKQWGQAMVRQAQWQATLRERKQILVAVSAANRPAIDMYGSTGFFAWQQRQTLVRFLREATP